MKKVSNTEAQLKKSVAYKNKRVIVIISLPSPKTKSGPRIPAASKVELIIRVVDGFQIYTIIFKRAPS